MRIVCTGEKFNRLTFLAIKSKGGAGKHRMGLWLCECGSQKEIAISRVVNGYSRSCGCLVRDMKTNLQHGMRGTPTYSSWQAMKNRCECPDSKDFPRYGAKGIRVCARWMSFENFLADMGIRPRGTTLDRYPDYSGSYEPGNCRWATPQEQARNRKDFVWINSPLGKIPLADYAVQLGISRGAAHQRLRRGKLEGCQLCA